MKHYTSFKVQYEPDTKRGKKQTQVQKSQAKNPQTTIKIQEKNSMNIQSISDDEDFGYCDEMVYRDLKYGMFDDLMSTTQIKCTNVDELMQYIHDIYPIIKQRSKYIQERTPSGITSQVFGSISNEHKVQKNIYTKQFIFTEPILSNDILKRILKYA